MESNMDARYVARLFLISVCFAVPPVALAVSSTSPLLTREVLVGAGFLLFFFPFRLSFPALALFAEGHVVYGKLTFIDWFTWFLFVLFCAFSRSAFIYAMNTQNKGLTKISKYCEHCSKEHTNLEYTGLELSLWHWLCRTINPVRLWTALAPPVVYSISNIIMVTPFFIVAINVSKVLPWSKLLALGILLAFWYAEVVLPIVVLYFTVTCDNWGFGDGFVCISFVATCMAGKCTFLLLKSVLGSKEKTPKK